MVCHESAFFLRLFPNHYVQARCGVGDRSRRLERVADLPLERRRQLRFDTVFTRYDHFAAGDGQRQFAAAEVVKRDQPQRAR